MWFVISRLPMYLATEELNMFDSSELVSHHHQEPLIALN